MRNDQTKKNNSNKIMPFVCNNGTNCGQKTRSQAQKQPDTTTPPTCENGTIYKRRKNKDIRPREYLSENDIKKLIQGAKNSPWYGSRDATLILIMFRHGLRVSEAVSLKWNQIDFELGIIHVERIKNGVNSTHPLSGSEIRALRSLKRESTTPYIFNSNRGNPLSVRTVRLIVAQAGQRAGFEYSIHPHMLRHSTGFYLAMNGQDTRAIQHYLGHASITSTVIYTHLDPSRFNGFFTD